MSATVEAAAVTASRLSQDRDRAGSFFSLYEEDSVEAESDCNSLGETVWGTQALIERVFAPAIVGRDPTDIAAIDVTLDALSRHNWFAKSAIEMACWDIAGKAAGKPLYEL